MITQYAYNRTQDKIVKLDPGKSTRSRSWLRIVSPDVEGIQFIADHTSIPIEELQESLEEEERPRVSSGPYLEIIYRAPLLVSNELETTPIYFYLFKDQLITIEKKPISFMDDIASGMDKGKFKFLFRKGFPYFVFYVMDKINDDYLHRIDKIAARIDLYENFSKKELTIIDIEKIYDQSVSLSFFNQALIANVEVLNSLKKGYYKLIQPRDRVLFEELYYNLLQILDTEKIQREAITQLINIHSIITSTRLNDFMKRLTILALIIAIPTSISGIYGMNFANIPLSDHPYGFYITSFIIGLFTLGVYVVARRMDVL